MLKNARLSIPIDISTSLKNATATLETALTGAATNDEKLFFAVLSPFDPEFILLVITIDSYNNFINYYNNEMKRIIKNVYTPSSTVRFPPRILM